VRQSVTIPAQLAREVRRVAKERNVTISRALVTLAERGVEAEAEARAKLTAAYEQFMAEADPARKSEVGEDLIRAIFGRSASLICLARCGSTFPNASPRAITLDDLQRLRAWVVADPWAPYGDWYKDFGSFVLCGTGEYPKTVLKKGIGTPL
jgi:hypothetical protein